MSFFEGLGKKDNHEPKEKRKRKGKRQKGKGERKKGKEKGKEKEGKEKKEEIDGFWLPRENNQIFLGGKIKKS